MGRELRPGESSSNERGSPSAWFLVRMVTELWTVKAAEPPGESKVVGYYFWLHALKPVRETVGYRILFKKSYFCLNWQE